MKKLLLFSLLAVTMLIATALRSAEIIPVWNKTINGDVQDIKFMPGNGDQFMLTTGLGEIQIRNSENGELIKSHIDSSQFFMNGYFEFTSDSNRVVMAKSGLLQLVDIKTFERLNYFAFGKDAVIKGFDDLVIDPIRPYVYVTVNGYSRETGDPSDIRSKVQVYNYETMKLVKDLTPYGEYNYTAIAVSPDGKYLATLNDNKTYLKVWDLQTMEQIRNVQLWDDKLPDYDWECEAKDIEFSSINDDVIYFSGYFPKKDNSFYPGGVFNYYLSNDNVKKIELDKGYDGGRFILFDNENQIFVYNGVEIKFLDLIKQKLELSVSETLEYPFKSESLYSKKSKLFIGYSRQFIGSLKYDSETGITNNYIVEIRVSPNPTDSFVNIALDCSEPIIDYSLNDINGLLILQSSKENSNGNFNIDFTAYPSGIYFLTIKCNNSNKTYKIVKEG